MPNMAATNYLTIQTGYLWKIFIPVAILIMAGSGISFLHPICNGDSRWIMLFFLFSFLILKKNFLRYFDILFFLILFSYIGWCILTSFWSAIPLLSLMKSCLFAIVVFTLIRLGIEWVKINSLENIFNYLIFLAFFSILAGILGKFYSQNAAYDIGSKIVIQYHGLVRGSNMFGGFMAMLLPLFLWKAYLSKRLNRIIWLGLIILTLYFLLASWSRSSIILSCVLFFTLLISLDISKKFKVFLAGFIFIFCVIFISPSILSKLLFMSQQLAYKGNTISLFASRGSNWENSYIGASEGGFFGLGYGISYGNDNFNFANELSSYDYGREKGNSQLAIIEETGLIGFIFYLSTIMICISKIFILYSKSNKNHEKFLISLICGTFLGFLLQSAFECWWTSPGSPESIYFWMLIGILRGLEIKLNLSKNLQSLKINNVYA